MEVEDNSLSQLAYAAKIGQRGHARLTLWGWLTRLSAVAGPGWSMLHKASQLSPPFLCVTHTLTCLGELHVGHQSSHAHTSSALGPGCKQGLNAGAPGK